MYEQISSFHGDGRDTENPQEFLKSISRNLRALNVTEDEARVEALGDYLVTGSVAEDWYIDAMGNNPSWQSLAIAFNIRWPPIARAVKTSAEYQQEILGLTLADKDVATTVSVGGHDVWSHTAWADKALQLAKQAKVEKGNAMIWMIREKMPEALRDQLKGEYADWTTFIDEVKALDIQKLKDGKRKREDRERDKTAMRQDILQQLQRRETTQRTTTDMNSLTNNFQRLAVTATPSMPQVNLSPQPGSRYALRTVTHPTSNPTARAPPTPLTDSQREEIRRHLTTIPRFPDNDTGRAAYTARVAQWETTHGAETRVNESTPFPLRPGTANVCSGECFKCGTHGHQSRNCPATLADRLDRRESTWRALCMRASGPINRDPTKEIHLVDLVTEEGNE